MDGILGDQRRGTKRGSTLGNVLASLDAFPKTLDDFKEQTNRGGWASIFAGPLDRKSVV